MNPTLKIVSKKLRQTGRKFVWGYTPEGGRFIKCGTDNLTVLEYRDGKYAVLVSNEDARAQAVRVSPWMEYSGLALILFLWQLNVKKGLMPNEIDHIDLEYLYTEPKQDRALDYLFLRIDDRCHQGRFEEIDEILAQVTKDFDRMSSTVAYGVNCITRPAKHKLKNFEAFKRKHNETYPHLIHCDDLRNNGK
jgi:hypothetical protein